MSTEIFLLGASLDAVEALEPLIAALPRSLPVAVVVVAPGRTAGDGLRERLAQVASLPVVEPEDKEAVQQGTLYLAPAGYQLMLDRGAFALSRETPIAGERPSVVPLFESAADAYADAAAGLVLTGHRGPHWESAWLLQERGGASAMGWYTPESEINIGPSELGGVPVLPLEAASDWMVEMCTSHHLRGAYERRHGS